MTKNIAQANQAISVGPVFNPHSPKVNGVHKAAASPSKPHFLDTGFKDAEVNVLLSHFLLC